MALGTNLAGLLVMLRAEARLTQTVSAGLNSDPTLRQLIKRTQDTLWLENDWPHLRVFRDITTEAGQRYYDPPADMDFNRIFKVEQKWNNLWREVTYGIGEHEYNLYDPDMDRRTDPVIRWMLTEDQKIELWPLAATSAIPIRFRGVKTIPLLVADSDVAALDDELIVLLAAAEVLTSTKALDAKAKLNAATSRMRRLMSGGVRRRYNMKGFAPSSDPRFPYQDDDPFRIRVTYARAG